ncbi:hypothetical protein [Planctomonas psychrotolerans]|uniref:hypothetical protein n=1 Tax=Planctomonas psychrotolerans TaxID=2528712 RepID=UPI001D0D5DCD|nr:hypothetical protein [Planctomonas psychrotolerans]
MASMTLGVVAALGATLVVTGVLPPDRESTSVVQGQPEGLPGPYELDRMDGSPAVMRSMLAAALHRWPEYYNGGLVGLDGLLNPTGVTAGAHPPTVQTWLTYVIGEAQAAQWDPSYDEDERGQILAFSHGLMRAAVERDVPRLTGPAAGDPGLPIAAPTAFLYDVFFDPARALPVNTCGDGRNGESESEAASPAYDTVPDDGCPGGVAAIGRAEPRRGYLADYFLDLRSDLEVVRERIRLDRDYIDAANGVTERRKMPINTVRGLRVASVDVKVCAGARDICLRDVTGDFAADERLWVAEKYASAWIDAIDAGLRDFGDLGVAVTRGLYDPQVLRHTRIAECGTSPSGIVVDPRSGCETQIDAMDAVLWSVEPFVTRHMLGMLGSPTALDAEHEPLQEFAGLFEGLVDPFVSPVRDGRHTLVTLAHAKIERAVQPALDVRTEEVPR